ncbi:UPF0481-like protein [Cinnamomum micranthum f. kanehirae]|uniref:UPF0481-like protein n=1 Tax=Cinnamomum micranthum f. kanehirae TaxID=337451 RepID=A0A3S3MVI7_9MAGN|nr:UPF0481-like protein [Cinnamomum micranthum f. kanehirae]
MVLNTSFYVCKICVPGYPSRIHVVSRYHCKCAPIDADVARKRGENLVVNVDGLWVTSMKEKLASISMYCKSSSPFTICRVPTNIRKDDHAAYSPKIVSIGPYHRGTRDLEGMEQHKWRYLREVLTHSKREKDLEKYLKEMKAIEPLARSCYAGNIKMGMKKFVEMMVLDGCFIVHLLQQKDDARNDDPIYSNSWMLPQIRHDMLLLENQLPLVVLECLCDLIGQPRATLKEQALSFFRTALPDEPDLKPPKASVVHHFLHLLHLSLEPEKVGGATAKRSPFQLCTVIEKIVFFLYPKYLAYAYKPQQSVKTIPTATGLREAGIKFKTKQSRSFLDVTFEHGLMQVPRLRISNFTNSLFRNFIALEQCFPHYGSDFTSYCFFMDSLVNTPRDVDILNRSEIIEHVLGSDEEVALLFNKLCKGVEWDFANSNVAKMFQQVTEYTRTRPITPSGPESPKIGSGGGCSSGNNNDHNNSLDDNYNGSGHGGGNNNDHNNSIDDNDNGGGHSHGGGGGSSGSGDDEHHE